MRIRAPGVLQIFTCVCIEPEEIEVSRQKLTICMGRDVRVGRVVWGKSSGGDGLLDFLRRPFRTLGDSQARNDTS